MITDRESLKDLPGVMVLVEDFSSRAEDAGFDRRTFQTDVELKLRMAGIKVAEDDDAPWLHVNVTVLHRERNKIDGYGINLGLIQDVLLESQVKTRGTTWLAGVVGIGDVDHVRTSVKNLIDTFINDWLAVNPIKRTA